MKHCWDCKNEMICLINKAFIDASTAMVQSGIDLPGIRDFAACGCNRFESIRSVSDECKYCGDDFDEDFIEFNRDGDKAKCLKCGREFDYETLPY